MFITAALSNATGDFVKTQDSWANQTRILTLRFQQLKASLGKGFIALFTPILRGFNSLLAGLQKVADGFASFVQMLTGADVSTSMGSISSDIAGIGDDASSAASLRFFVLLCSSLIPVQSVNVISLCNKALISRTYNLVCCDKCGICSCKYGYAF